MGVYVYRVTAKKVKCSDGEMANVAVFAYKPFMSFFDNQSNAKMHFKTGCVSSDSQARKGKLTNRIVVGNSVFENVCNRGTYYDDLLGGKDLPKLEGVTV